MEKYTNVIEANLEEIKNTWKKEVEKFNEAEKLLESGNKTQKLKIAELVEQNLSLKDTIAAQDRKIEAQEQTIKEQQLQIDILEAEKKSFEARFNEVNLKLKQQQLKQQASHAEIPPLRPDQIEKEVKKEQSSSVPVPIMVRVPLVNTPQSTFPQAKQQQSTAPQSSQAKNLKRPADTATDTSESEVEPENPPPNQEQKRYVCGFCLDNWYQHETLKAPRNIVKSFITVSRLQYHIRQNHPHKIGLIFRAGSGAICDSNCIVPIATGETKPKRFKCTARTSEGPCHEKFQCRFHYDRHIAIDHANISALDKYSLADLYKKHLKK